MKVRLRKANFEFLELKSLWTLLRFSIFRGLKSSYLNRKFENNIRIFHIFQQSLILMLIFKIILFLKMETIIIPEEDILSKTKSKRDLYKLFTLNLSPTFKLIHSRIPTSMTWKVSRFIPKRYFEMKKKVRIFYSSEASS